MTTAARRNPGEIMRDEMIMRDRIADLLKAAPLTIPALAENLGAPSHEVTLWLMAMRRYGQVEETGRPDADGYFTYALKEEQP